MFKKLERIIFYLLIFTTPFQARVVLYKWTEHFNQWTSAYLYGTDLLLAAVFLFWLIRTLKAAKIFNFQFSIFNQFSISKFLNAKRLMLNANFWLIIFFAVSALSIFSAQISGLSWYQLLKLSEFVGLFFCVKHNFGKVFQLKSLLMVVVASGLFQAVIGIAQYLKQGSVGLRLLGESPLSVNTTGVAIFFVGGEPYLRAYGATPHPNILAAWLLVSIFAFYCLCLRRALSTWWLIGYSVLLSAFLFTFSRTVIGLWGLGMLAILFFIFFKKESFQADVKRKFLRLFTTTLVVGVIFSVIFWPQVSSRIHISAQDPAFLERVFYNKVAGSMTVNRPLLGIGIGQFVPSLMSELKHLPSSAYQPVHNLYLLIASETGFVGLGAFLLFILFVFWSFIKQADFNSSRTFYFLLFTFSFLLVGLFDHFPWTSQQGSLIFWGMLALLTVKLK